MNKGTNIDIIIPSSLAYGAAGTIDIPPYMPLLFSMKMKDLKPVSR
jgi:FKBP-type peptidyl-prolyl cis-trans isomerase FkpA